MTPVIIYSLSGVRLTSALPPAEGLVLKPAKATYLQHRWQKMKRDYIPGLGDTVDLVLLGASWDAKRARELNGASSDETVASPAISSP